MRLDPTPHRECLSIMPLADSQYGKEVRFNRILAVDRPTLMVPLDDALIFGPTGHFRRTRELLQDICRAGVDSILAFSGTLQKLEPTANLGRIVNVSASTTRYEHTRKVVVCSIHRALTLGADAVAVHVNLTSRYESSMLKSLARVVDRANLYGLPVMAIAYPR